MIRLAGAPSVWVRIGLTVGLFWGVFLLPLAGMWQNTATYVAALIPAAVFLAGSIVWVLHMIWTAP